MKREAARHQEAFELWYAADHGAAGSAAVRERFGVSQRSVEKWAAAFEWGKRADRRDAEAATRADREAVKRRTRILEDQRRAGELMRRRGTEFLIKNEITSARDAVAAIVKGIQLERSADQLPDFMLEILQMDEGQLHAERDRLVRQAMRECQTELLPDEEESAEN